MSTSESSMAEKDVAQLTREPKESSDDHVEEKLEYRSQGSPPPAKAMPPKPRDPQGPLPVRPPSAMSSQSGTAPSRTTTSRRGGRQLSRSPPIPGSRSGSTSMSEREYSDDRQSPANLSSAAAAAAAAAQALSSNSVNRNPHWFEPGQDAPMQHDRRPDSSRHPQTFDNRYPGSRHWPGEDDPGGRGDYRTSRLREGELDSRPYSNKVPYPSNRSNSGSKQEGYRASEHHFDRQDANAEQESRFQDCRDGPYKRDGDRSSSKHADRHHLRYSREPDHSIDFFRGPEGMASTGDEINRQGVYSPKTLGARDATRSPSTVKQSGGTSRIIGTATPIHVPRAVDPPGPGRHSAPPAGTPPSVFRRRPGEDLSCRKGPPEDDSPQKILLSLKTPSASFEEHPGLLKQGKINLGNGRPPLSPDEPPQIHHSHNQHHMEQNIFFDQPNRGGSPKALSSASMGVLEMAPSFSLFNQSFDSLGDTAQYLNVSGPLESTFNSASFGAGPSASRDNADVSQLLPNNSQGDSFAAGERFLGSSSGGNYTFGMSPVNSYGNDPQTGSSRPSGTMMVLGGPDQQPSSPTQLLNMYPSYSGGYGGQASGTGQAPFRSRSGQVHEHSTVKSLGSGSFGASSSMYRGSYDVSPHGNYYPSPSHDEPRQQDGPSNFYAFLDRNKSAFIKCTFLLPGLKASMLESPISDSQNAEVTSSGRKLSLGGRLGRFAEPTPQDTAIAMRRIACAICAFGGTISGDRGTSTQGKTKDNKQSIFRDKDEDERVATVAVTPSSSTGTPPGTRGEQSRANHRYDELLPTRYYENDNRLSWEFEESPPVGADDDQHDQNESEIERISGIKAEDIDDPSRIDSSPTPSDDDQKPSSESVNDDGSKAGGPESDQPKMRYRCKLCGLPKQNHTCAYQQSLQRSIGVMVYPAVNAFTSGEPGLLAPNLTDMNNFVINQNGDGSSTEDSPSRPTPDRPRRNGQASMPGIAAPNVTPETMRSSNSSSSSGNSGGLRTPLRSPASTTRKPRGSNLSGGAAMGQRVGTGSPPGSQSRKRTHAQMSSGGDEDLLFVDTVDLKPEQFRIVTPSKKLPRDAYTYPSLPLPYAQRKRLSDNLFALSKEVPQLTDECAVVLREARERDMWDLAVAELMTQVVVVIHCNGSDCRFEGLRHYLLTLGIAC